ncbi:thioredoxin-disulfide reductase [Candidatus Woesearchaeota archaeon]|nr:MAG: thioredoxin-disulfide reductase [Candidatus Woesearchaeota archaeon]
MAEIYDVIIIGGGAAGLTAAIYASRANLKTLVVEGEQPGGQLVLTSVVENFPGFPEGIQGAELMQRIRKQAERFGPEFIKKNVTSVDFSKKPFVVSLGDQNLEAKSVIIATGSKPRRLGLDSEKRLIGRGVTYCATCDGYFFKDKEVIVVGGGDAAMEEALFLAKLVRKVSVVHRRDKLRASKIMQERAFKNEKIVFIWDSVVEEILGENMVEGVKLRNVKTNKVSEHKTDGVFVAIGHIPNTEFLKGQLEIDQKGYIVVRNHVFTSKKGVFSAGDVNDFNYMQAITASAMGCMAAIQAERYLEQDKK